MSELEKAKQELEQVCFAYHKAGDTGDIKDWKKYYDLENKLIDKVKIANQPQLTIPKSIADMAYKYRDTYNLRYSKTVWEWIQSFECKEKAEALLQAYLAGKALGVDLVKVVEG